MISALGTVSYGSGANKVTFDGYIESSVNAVPVYDEANRTITYIRYLISIKGRVGGAAATDATLDQWRSVLLTPALEFHYDAHGFGNTSMTINAPGGTISDVAWGPLPQSLSFQPLGGGYGALVNWSVIVNIPACTGGSAKYTPPAIAAFNFDVNWSIDDEGLTTRTISGYLEIPETRKIGSRTVLFTADDYLEQVVPVLLNGFRRTSNRKLSKDKRTLQFSFTDTEMPYPLPEGVTRCTCEHSVESDWKNGGFMIWKCTLNASISMR